jgi:hypothetical protein
MAMMRKLTIGTIIKTTSMFSDPENVILLLNSIKKSNITKKCCNKYEEAKIFWYGPLDNIFLYM